MSLSAQLNTPSTLLYSCAGCGLNAGDNLRETGPASSILDPLSKCNDPPSSLDHAALRREFEALSETIISLNTTIDRLQASIDTLKSKRRELDALSPAYKSVLNPCRQLPNEILAKIFILCVDRDISMLEDAITTLGNSVYPSTLDTKRSPWVLSQVCVRWRNLALSLPKLWSTIDLYWTPNLKQPCHAPFIDRRLAQTLQRAGNRPLSISWRHMSCRDTTFSVLCSRAFQWKEARIRAPAGGLQMLVPYSDMFFALSSLELYLENEDRAVAQDGNPDPGFSVFRTASNLRTLVLCSASIKMPASHVLEFPLHQITTLTLDAGPTYENLQTVLPSLVNIEDCAIGDFDFVHDQAKPRLTLPRLHSLNLATGKASAIEAFLESVTIPSLSTFRISLQSSLPVIRFLQRSSCPIGDLELRNATDDVLIDVLKARELQGTKHLIMTGPGDHNNNRGRPSINSISDGVLRVLMFQPTGEILFPHLEVLSLEGIKRYSDTTLVDLLVSRREIDQFAPRTVSPLWYADIDTQPQDFAVGDEAATIKLRELIEGGLKTNIRGDQV